MVATLRHLALVLGVLYAGGSPILAPLRPALLDQALRGFHDDIGAVAAGGLTLLGVTSPHDPGARLAGVIPTLHFLRRADRDLARVSVAH